MEFYTIHMHIIALVHDNYWQVATNISPYCRQGSNYF